MRVYQSVIQLPRLYGSTAIWQCQRQASTVAISQTNTTRKLTCANNKNNRTHSYMGQAAEQHYHTQHVRLVIGDNSCGRDHHHIWQPHTQSRQLWSSAVCRTTDKHNSDEIAPSLSQYQAYDMIHKLTDQERTSLKNALNQYESDIVKSKLQGKRDRAIVFLREQMPNSVW